MPHAPTGCVVLGAIAAILTAVPVLAESRSGYDHQIYPHASARTLPPETRYRDPRYQPPRRRGPHFGPPVDLIQAYLPRTTETPLYNEPPSRFPRR